MPKDYPNNITWMIEARDWPDKANPVSTAENPEVPEWKKYVPEQATSFGTGVVIRLEQLTQEDKPMASPQIKNYLLTCGHVVRVGENGFGPVAKEIVCWHPEYGYFRTKRGNPSENEGRFKGKMEGGHAAKLSALSPYDGRSDVVPVTERKKQRDWVLLDVADVVNRDPFETEPRVTMVQRPIAGWKTTTVGYPAGAGWEKNTDGSYSGEHLITDGEVPEAKHSAEHPIEKVENEIITYHGVVHTRAGMSGGGVFRNTDLTLVGLHRSRDDGAMQAEAICVADILEWLRTHRHLRPVFPPVKAEVEGVCNLPTGRSGGDGTGGKEPNPKWWEKSSAIAAMLSALVALAAWLWPEPGEVPASNPVPTPVPTPEVAPVLPVTTTYYWKGTVVEEVEGQEKPVEGVSVKVFASNVTYHELSDITDSDGRFDISTNEHPFTTGVIQLRISKSGYELVSDPHRHAVADETYRPMFTIKKVTTQP